MLSCCHGPAHRPALTPCPRRFRAAAAAARRRRGARRKPGAARAHDARLVGDAAAADGGAGCARAAAPGHGPAHRGYLLAPRARTRAPRRRRSLSCPCCLPLALAVRIVWLSLVLLLSLLVAGLGRVACAAAAALSPGVPHVASHLMSSSVRAGGVFQLGSGTTSWRREARRWARRRRVCASGWRLSRGAKSRWLLPCVRWRSGRTGFCASTRTR